MVSIAQNCLNALFITEGLGTLKIFGLRLPIPNFGKPSHPFHFLCENISSTVTKIK